MAQTIGDRLERLLADRNWSQGELARRTGLTRSAISQLVQGATEPSLATIRKLAAALEVTEGEIIDDTAAPSRTLRASSGPGDPPPGKAAANG